ncbi:MAG: class I SAM-dependent DNA methyltransferase, partial [Actinomycetota bacterium]|nr:class I SAM-dependent DNA methyltransferase [Actinomycetota bacterium]
ALGDGPDTLPLNKVRTITVANALRTDWTEIVEQSEHLYVMGNPPFLGMISRSVDQVADLDSVWGEQRHGSQDYVTGWHKKCLDLFSAFGYQGQFAFVSTNSITQGEPVAPTFRPIFAAGWRIGFAHRTFIWTSEAANSAQVHCVIVGFDKRTSPPRLFDYRDHRGDPVVIPVLWQINAYLVDGPNVLVDAVQRPIAPDLPEIINGNKPADGGHLLVEQADHSAVTADPVAAKYVRPFVGARELVQGAPRWCLWMPVAAPADIAASPILKARFDAVKEFRLASTLKATRDSAATPYRFWYVSHRDVPHVVIPRHVSETRAFFTAALANPEVISGDANFTAEDASGLAFSIISSSMFIAWQRTVGGRIKSDLRFGKLPVWNTFPLPKLSDDQRDSIIAGGEAVLDARALRPERSLAQHYNPLAMDPTLLKAHAQLDRTVDAVFGQKESLTEADRLAALFASYERLISDGQLMIPSSKKGRRK